MNKADVVDEAGVSARRMRDIIKRRAADAGIEGRVSGHSFRIGTAQSLRRAGTDDTELMEAGRWKRVETMARYVRTQDAALGPVARHRYGVEPPDGFQPGRHESATPRRCCCGEPQANKTAALTTEELSHLMEELSRTREELLHTRKEAEKLRKTVAQLENAVVGSTKADLRNKPQPIVFLKFLREAAVQRDEVVASESGRSQRSAPGQPTLRLRARKTVWHRSPARGTTRRPVPSRAAF